MSYTIDVYRGKIKAANFIDVALYISFFPQLVAGPIVKAQDFLPQLKEDRRVTLKSLEVGLQIFVMGMFKKIVLADHLSVFVDDIFATPVAFSSMTVILAVVAYAFQIYFDFSGYSDMAVGCAKCLGYDINRNFNLPYISKNPTEFWKRWHISLSTWLQEYLYIPLGGNRKGKRRTYINLMLTMLIGGLWHGANWTFVVWGLLHGIALCIHKVYLKLFSTKVRIPIVLSVIMNNVFVCICWVFFRASSFDVAVEILKKAFIWSAGLKQVHMWLIFALVIEIIYVVWCARISKAKQADDSIYFVNAFYFHHNLNTIWGLTLFFLEIMAIIGFAYTAASPFIYFQF
jgi:alginate O-acetyltransferase complex protein AlgI